MLNAHSVGSLQHVMFGVWRDLVRSVSVGHCMVAWVDHICFRKNKSDIMEKEKIDVSHLRKGFCFIQDTVRTNYVGWLLHGYKRLYFATVDGVTFVSVYYDICVYDRNGKCFYLKPDYSIVCKSLRGW